MKLLAQNHCLWLFSAKKCIDFGCFQCFVSKGAQCAPKATRGALMLEEDCLIQGDVIGKEMALFWKTVVETSMIKNVLALCFWCHCPWLWKNKNKLRPIGKIVCQNKTLSAACSQAIKTKKCDQDEKEIIESGRDGSSRIEWKQFHLRKNFSFDDCDDCVAFERGNALSKHRLWDLFRSTCIIVCVQSKQGMTLFTACDSCGISWCLLKGNQEMMQQLKRYQQFH